MPTRFPPNYQLERNTEEKGGWEEETPSEIGLVTSICSLENRNLLIPRCLRQDAGPEMNKPESLI